MKTLLDFYKEHFYDDRREFLLGNRPLMIDTYHLGIRIGEHTFIYHQDAHRFPYPKTKRTREMK